MSDLKDMRDNIREMVENIERDNPIFAENMWAFMNTLYDEIEQLQADKGVMRMERTDCARSHKKHIEQLQEACGNKNRAMDELCGEIEQLRAEKHDLIMLLDTIRQKTDVLPFMIGSTYQVLSISAPPEDTP